MTVTPFYGFTDDVLWCRKHQDWVEHSPSQTQRIKVDLSSNRITSLSPKTQVTGRVSQKLEMCEPLLIVDIDFDGNPINCTHPDVVLTYKYLVSRSRSLVPERPEHNLPDFSFYEKNLKCADPPEWKGIPLMQIPEVEYSALYQDKSNASCPESCHCYHSWRHGGVHIANCTPTDKAPLTKFPKIENHVTFTHIILAHNKLKYLCWQSQTHASLSKITNLDVSWNGLNNICDNIWGELTHLTTLNLAYNKINKLSSKIGMLGNLSMLNLLSAGLEELPREINKLTASLTHVNLHGNVFRCDCDTFWIRSWLSNHTNIVNEPHSLICFSGKGKGKRILELTEDNVGCYDLLKIQNHKLEKMLFIVGGIVLQLSCCLLSLLSFCKSTRVTSKYGYMLISNFIHGTKLRKIWLTKTMMPLSLTLGRIQMSTLFTKPCFLI